MSTFTKIKALKDSLSSSELKLAKFALDSSSAIRELSSLELANVVGVSQSSVVKFSQKLGYKGYPAFKMGVIDALNIATASNNLHGKITINDSFSQMSDKLLSSKVSVLNETQKLNDEAAFIEAVELLKSSKRILICGLGGSALVGKDFSYKLQKLGMLAIEEPDAHAQLAFAATLSENDLVFAISESGSTKEMINVVTEAKNNKAKIISVTRFGSTPISDMANLKLYSVADDESARLSSILTRTAQEFIIDILFIAITQSSRQGRQILEKTNTVVSDFRRSM
ncbi:MurR/RpiR family transcriptional regulator [uncultured Psychrosphaera sp.]|jgi:DNA-binding MurR/RpiR family transcriptional regulator|uniref:MurR/RpiR family transcriptional regulator n=1 Tax=uncultured Psychrosphaera sp. TaxID=1403522 RepID=UPI002604B6E9|nr:MurR/RpiR family transcriptional regulator [uncultured Psychrosphaera sp.]